MIKQIISVAMCTYNGAAFLSEQLESIAAQIRLPDELVICDDMSTDNTVGIIRQFAVKAPFKVTLFINDMRLGSTKNFEKCIEFCTGNVIVLSDQDDVWINDKLELIEDVFIKSAVTGAVISDAIITDEMLTPLDYTLWQSIGFTSSYQARVNNNNAFQVLLKRNFATGATMAFRAEYKDFVLPIEDNWIHDGWIALFIAAISNIALINKPLILYRHHANNQCGAQKKSLADRIQTQAKCKMERIYSSCKQYEAFFHRLCEYNPSNAVILKPLSEKIYHLYVRACVPHNRLLRFFYLLKEFISLRYHRYSNGIKSFGNDLL